MNILEHGPDVYLDELQEELELQGIEISLASLCRYLDRNGMTHKRVCLFMILFYSQFNILALENCSPT